MFVKGYVENHIIIIETEGFGVFSLPLNIIKKILVCMYNNFK